MQKKKSLFLQKLEKFTRVSGCYVSCSTSTHWLDLYKLCRKSFAHLVLKDYGSFDSAGSFFKCDNFQANPFKEMFHRYSLIPSNWCLSQEDSHQTPVKASSRLALWDGTACSNRWFMLSAGPQWKFQYRIRFVTKQFKK